MNAFKAIRTRLGALLSKRKLDSEMCEEMRLHIELRTQANIEAGMNPETARSSALRQFGWTESIKEVCRDQRGIVWFEQLVQDVRFGARQLRKNPGFASVAILTLALGIGANAAIFSVFNAVLLRPMPYPDSDRLVAVCETNPHLGLDHYVTSMGAYFDWRERTSVFQELAGATVLGQTPIRGRNGTGLINVAAVSANFFPLLGIQPLLGRPFLGEEETPEHGNAVLLSEGLWRSRFGANPDILNQAIELYTAS